MLREELAQSILIGAKHGPWKTTPHRIDSDAQAMCENPSTLLVRPVQLAPIAPICLTRQRFKAISDQLADFILLSFQKPTRYVSQESPRISGSARLVPEFLDQIHIVAD